MPKPPLDLPKDKVSRRDDDKRMVLVVSCALSEAEVFPEAHRKRTRVVGLFPGRESLLRLVTSVLIEISETWEIGSGFLPVLAFSDYSAREAAHGVGVTSRRMNRLPKPVGGM